MLSGLSSLTALNVHGVRRLHAAGLQPLRGLLLLELALGSSCVKVCASVGVMETCQCSAWCLSCISQGYDRHTVMSRVR